MAELKVANRLFDSEQWVEAIQAYRVCIGRGLVVSAAQKSNVYFSLGRAYRRRSGIQK